ncbi:MAG: AtpZ/AtpI family protein [Acidobacteriota bacterium]
MAKRTKELRRARIWLDVSIVGIQFPVAIALGFFFGRWLDDQLGTAPWLMLIFSLFGIAAGFLNLFRITAKAGRDEKLIDNMETEEGNGDNAQRPAG